MPAIRETIPANIDSDASCDNGANDSALLSEQSPAEDWSRREEDEAWSHLQRRQSQP